MRRSCFHRCRGFGTDAVPAASGELPGVLRILLTRLGITTQADIRIDGTYTMDIGGITLLFPHGSEITVLLIGDRLYIDYEGMRLGSAAALTLTRCQDGSGEENGLRFYSSDSLYEGDLSLTVSEGVIRPILSIAVEDYLLGVVPYEMSDSFPLEALKAQTIAARTYAVRKARMNASADYDLADTTSDQVFKGRNSDHNRTEEAVRATAGVCAFYNGSLAMCYYGSSNGGQTELVENQWGAGDETGYLDMRDDPYDLENVKSVVKSAILPKTRVRHRTDALRPARFNRREPERNAEGTGIRSRRRKPAHRHYFRRVRGHAEVCVPVAAVHDVPYHVYLFRAYAHRSRHHHLPCAHLRPHRRGRGQPVYRDSRTGDRNARAFPNACAHRDAHARLRPV